ncbi:hypothetical protein [Aggregatilinea lenta]|uniref:hypothetical protein n=1 Tax=Aggregatilinea lenta TaxID=913108 RepID=UPI000E5BA431|nr:hypothetical protein [Aggregatilinea lenta]
MAAAPQHLVNIGSSFEQAYRPVLDFDGWKVAMLRHFDVVAPETLRRVERHWNTNEVFILTAGEADLIVLDGQDQPERVYVIPMQHNVAYNVRQSVWHHVIMSRDAHIVLVERSETGPETTDYAELDPALLDLIRAQIRPLC